MGALFRLESGIADQKNCECASQRRSRDFSRVRPLHDLAILSSAREFGRIQISCAPHLARIRWGTGHRAPIAVMANEERVRSEHGRTANFLSSTKRLHVAEPGAVNSCPPLAIARARSTRRRV